MLLDSGRNSIRHVDIKIEAGSDGSSIAHVDIRIELVLVAALSHM